MKVDDDQTGKMLMGMVKLISNDVDIRVNHSELSTGEDLVRLLY